MAYGLSGCAAFRPIHGMPVKYLPNEYRAKSRSGKKTIDPSLLRQIPPAEYQLDSGDILGVYIEGVLGARDQVPPVFYPRDEEVPPSFGYPRPVRDDGTISLPMIDPLYVRGMSIRQLEETLRQEYIHKRQILQPGNDRILVMLQKPRNYRVLVIRQEAGNNQTMISARGTINIGQSKRGTGQVVNLPAYENDVLHALAETGGLPGLDAENTIYIIRRKTMPAQPTVPMSAPSGQQYGPAPQSSAMRYGAYDSHQQYAQGAFEGSPIRQVQYEEAVYDEYSSGDYHDEYGTHYAEYHETSYGYNPPVDERNFKWLGGGHTSPGGMVADNEQLSGGHSLPQQRGVDATSYQQASPNYYQPGYDDTQAPYGWYDAGSQYGSQPGPAAGTWSDYGPAAWDMSPTSLDPTIDNPNTIKIPVRLAEGEQVHFSPQDILLQDGDVVFIESRDTEIFYTGGLLGGGQYSLPRDYDLDILGALSIAQSQGSGNQSRSMGGASALNQDVTISASRVVILRSMENGDQVPIEINLYDALRNPHERILIQPGDYILLQYTPLEAVGAFIERNLLEGALFGLATSTLTTGGGN
ncbi:MAG: polysaccharide biosynthesis/export family protein [Planctomycetota bacterium]|nr:polysaccharide biosynthesis/export family protein [Planctomycetota bacterium]MDA1212675.1 polysaccharide biosynthesis/export family protein [Planctomycetota bacterium]